MMLAFWIANQLQIAETLWIRTCGWLIWFLTLLWFAVVGSIYWEVRPGGLAADVLTGDLHVLVSAAAIVVVIAVAPLPLTRRG